MMKKKKEEEEEKKGEATVTRERSVIMISPEKIKTSPKREPLAPSSADRKSTRRVLSDAPGPPPGALKTSPKDAEVGANAATGLLFKQIVTLRLLQTT